MERVGVFPIKVWKTTFNLKGFDLVSIPGIKAKHAKQDST
ncbi:hypothetical protein Desti_0511 [Desulfomonile tiedjei DSM 6799]|uniref:Uncharacterized protein n=1 Tax=Desulfomonile tiedjei (strain ATCC 49306 / DSM 6799 / DCB-1) TaxID=706587 RepID=I4C103_DESTA|nr:hypothetical protein Desti_0511 [Desulfomonile tiedjei DSM 6799]